MAMVCEICGKASTTSPGSRDDDIHSRESHALLTRAPSKEVSQSVEQACPEGVLVPELMVTPRSGSTGPRYSAPCYRGCVATRATRASWLLGVPPGAPILDLIKIQAAGAK